MALIMMLRRRLKQLFVDSILQNLVEWPARTLLLTLWFPCGLEA